MSNLPERVRAAAGQTIYTVGHRGDRAFLLLNGQVQIDDPTLSASETIPAGAIFGELALVNDGVREATAVALGECDLLSFSASQLAPALSHLDPMLRIALGAIVERHSRLTAAQLAGEAGPPAVLPLWREGLGEALRVVAFEHELRAGLNRDELELFFQPITRLASGRVAGFEALVRWRHPTRGLLQPGDFIPLAETAGLIGEVTTFCLREVGRRFPALRAAARSGTTAEAGLFVSVNVAASDLAGSAFAATTVGLLEEGGVEPEEVRLEVTESILMTDIERCTQTLRNCRDQGFRIAIDDFGTGYSSLHLLSTLPLSILKMDRSFCATAISDEAGRKVIAAILRLGHELGLQVVAEGIETRAQAELMRSLNCDFGQGFLFGGPLDLAAACTLAGNGAVIAPAA